MAKEFMCQFGNCTITAEKMPILITARRPSDTEQVRFCSMRHAALWCAKEADTDERYGVKLVEPMSESRRSE